VVSRVYHSHACVLTEHAGSCTRARRYSLRFCPSTCILAGPVRRCGQLRGVAGIRRMCVHHTVSCRFVAGMHASCSWLHCCT
jgi:hypothetical protein